MGIGRAAVAWTILVAAVLIVGFSMSEGEPDCEGPFILRVDDSLPLQCEPPSQVLPQALVVWAVGLALILAVGSLARITGSVPTGHD